MNLLPNLSGTYPAHASLHYIQCKLTACYEKKYTKYLEY
jgi:hypothetical protein